jgi:hypothetical protein
MPMKLIQLPLHLSPDQALTLLDFVEQLQATLWNHYGDAIAAELRPISRENGTEVSGDATPDLENPIPF